MRWRSTTMMRKMRMEGVRIKRRIWPRRGEHEKMKNEQDEVEDDNNGESNEKRR